MVEFSADCNGDGIVDGADSEVGQQVLRDLILSFLLPRELLGARKTLLLPREAIKRAGVEHGLLLSQAHDVAMRGAPWSFSDDENEIHKACALLAGVAILTTRGGEDPIRKQDAFVGRVNLPFFETSPPNAGVKRLALSPDQQRWVLYKIGKQNIYQTFQA